MDAAGQVIAWASLVMAVVIGLLALIGQRRTGRDSYTAQLEHENAVLRADNERLTRRLETCRDENEHLMRKLTLGP